MRKVKGFSYNPVRDKDVIEHINKQPNGSQYIWSLVRKDMRKQENEIEKIVKKYIEEYLQKHNISEKQQDIDINSVMDILNME